MNELKERVRGPRQGLNLLTYATNTGRFSESVVRVLWRKLVLALDF